MPPLCTVGYGLATMQPRFIFGALYLFSINALFIMLATAFVTKLMGIPSLQNGELKSQKRVKRLISAITVLAVIPSVLIGGFKVYQTVMEQNFANYLANEFYFSDAQIVKSDMDLFNRNASVSLIGTQIPDEVIERLEQELPQYDLNGYTLSVTQNHYSQVDSSDMVTIAVQEKTIQELKAQVEAQQEHIGKMEAALAAQIDCKQISENAEIIFTKLSYCSCGVMSDADGDYMLLYALVDQPLLPEEEQTIQNWLRTEADISRTKLIFTFTQSAYE